MERRLRVVAGGRSVTITGVERGEWDRLSDPCPDCGGREFAHVGTAGARYGVRNGGVVRRADIWDAERPLFTRCRACGAVLYKHPAFVLRFDPRADGVVGLER
ncbi:hypothetical protein [Halobellus rubicundus]|uniref:Uncharacterized protein n=1 Tax=Halobellus rubicundus TaxID=2996466 RepID=A0ABD5MA37_9EURY